MSASAATGPKAGHQVLLDWLRFLAALLVVLCHVRPEHWVAWDSLADENRPLAALFFLLIRPGPEAVVVFFVLSGYLVGGKLIERVRAGSFRPADYCIDRASRIFTPLLAAFPLTFLCVWWIRDGLPPGFGREFLGNLFQLQGVLVERLTGNAPLWSLSYEVWFYVLGGALATLAMPGGGARRRLAALGLGLFAAWCLVMLHTAYLACWVLGALAYAFPPARPGGGAALFAGGLALAAVALCQATGSYQGALWLDSPALHSAGILLLGASIARLLPWLAALRPPARAPAWIAAGPALAAFSYTLYLTHFPVLLLLRRWTAPHPAFDAASVALFFAKVALCLLVAWLLYLPFERQTPAVRSALRRLVGGPRPLAPTP